MEQINQSLQMQQRNSYLTEELVTLQKEINLLLRELILKLDQKNKNI
jgi:hypothetical protein